MLPALPFALALLAFVLLCAFGAGASVGRRRERRAIAARPVAPPETCGWCGLTDPDCPYHPTRPRHCARAAEDSR